MLLLNPSLKQALEVAKSLAKENHHAYFCPAHLLKALFHPEVGLAEFVQSIGHDAAYIQDWAEVRIEDVPKIGQLPDIITGDPTIEKTFEEADNIRIKLGMDYITPICCLAAMAKAGIAFSSEQLKSFPIKEKKVLDAFLQEDTIQKAIHPSASSSAATSAGSNTGALQKYCIDKTSVAREGKTDPIIGRDKEVRLMMEILCRRTKPNVVIIGEAGVGKTALVEGLAQNIADGLAPAQLKDSLLFELDLGALIAGASYKGEVEDRLKKIIKDIKQYEKAILFIDEIHILLDPKGSFGSGPANLLKPELARGELTAIGATTADEYRKFLEPDPAFIRRFEVLQVMEPDLEACEKMVEKLAGKFEEHHKIGTDTEALHACVHLAHRYLKDRRLPDAAIDLLDRTMASIKLMVDTNAENLAAIQKQLTSYKENKTGNEGTDLKEIKWIFNLYNNKLSPVLLGMISDERQADKFESAQEFEDYLTDNLEKLGKIDISEKKAVTKEDIIAVIAYKTGIPMGKITANERERLLKMEDHLRERVLGQDHAIKSLSDTVMESRSGLGKKGQPVGSFFFLGPTGTGKTELAKSLAAFLFNDEKSMIRFDMSEFKEEHSAALLYGAPPGYVGYEEGGMLVNKIRKQPYSVLLFDEVEKAHPSVFDIFLQIMDEGIMHDRLGKAGDFSNAIIIFTSNIGSEWIAEQFEKGITPSSQQLMEIMARYFRPEFLARVTEIVPFASIHEDNLVAILDIQMKSLLASLRQKGIDLKVTPEAKAALATKDFTPKYGARQISGIVRNYIRRPLSKFVISGALNKGDEVVLDFEDNSLIWKINDDQKNIVTLSGQQEETLNPIR